MPVTDFPFPLKLPNHSVYKMRGTDKTVVRAKGGPSADKMKNDPKLAGSRKQQAQFSAGSSSATSLRDAMYSIKHLADFALHGHFIKLNSAIMKLDPDNPLGKKSLIYSRGLHFFEGLSLNRSITFDSVVTTTIPFSLDREHLSATLQLPALTAGINFNSPWKQPFFRFRANLGIIRDKVFVPLKDYQELTPTINDKAAAFDTEWFLVNKSFPGMQVDLEVVNPDFDENCHLILSVGIEFGNQFQGTIEHVKYAGCGKILSMS